ncbi:MAG: 1,4-alpha-glucan branching enzyme, partial [Saprospiraceae bacterium]
FTPVTRDTYRIGVPVAGTYKEIFNTDDRKYGGSGFANAAELTSIEEKQHGRPNALDIALPPLGVVVFKLEKRKKITKNVSGRTAVKKTVKAKEKKLNAKA